jgi:hypothetical protein
MKENKKHLTPVTSPLIELCRQFEDYFRLGGHSPGTPEFVALTLDSLLSDFASTDAPQCCYRNALFLEIP